MFLHEQSKGNFITTHIYLIFGCGLPAITINLLSPTFNGVDVLIALSGLMFLSFGDTFSGIIGGKFGKMRWPRSKKTFLGTFSCFVSILLGYLLLSIIGIFSITLCFKSPIILGIFLTSMYEGYTLEHDNVIVPCFFISILKLLT